jgi:hypothetical protein
VDKEKSKDGKTRFKQTGLTGMNSDLSQVWILLGRIRATGSNRVGEAAARPAAYPDRACKLAGPWWADGWASARPRMEEESGRLAGPMVGFSPHN